MNHPAPPIEEQQLLAHHPHAWEIKLYPLDIPLLKLFNTPDDQKHTALLEKYYAHEVEVQKNLKDLKRLTSKDGEETIRMSLAFKDLSIWVNEKKRVGFCKNEYHPKSILTTMSGKFEPGTMTAIIGPSGSGKTTLMNFLSQRLGTSALKIDGDIFLNGKQLKDLKSIKGKIGYVTQFDDLYALATVEECFDFVADMLYQKIMTREERKELTNHTIDQLRLDKCRGTIIGNELIRGCSGGERKRVSIGCQLIMKPSILFMDEPTTGLDAMTALESMQIGRG
jgi:energy-coupling factor transporter ATP-binding protein EcfA2